MESSVTEGEIDNTRAYIKGSIADMQSLLVDVENNIAKDEGSFKKVEDNWVRDRCNFRKVCDSAYGIVDDVYFHKGIVADKIQ